MKRKLYLSILTALVVAAIAIAPFGDYTNDNDLVKTPEQMAKEEFERKREKRLNGYHKSDKPDEFAKWNEAIRTPDGKQKPEYKFNYKLNELNKAKQNNNNARTEALDWEERGPANVPGRTRGLIVFPSDPNAETWLAGSVGGGIWKTTDAGESWVNKTPDLPHLGTTTLAMAASDNNIIYAGTGEQYAGYNAVNGDGIFKSMDGGETWTQLAATANDNFRNVNRLVVSPTDPNIVVAATSNSYWGGAAPQSKIMRSTDGGASWTKVYENNNDIDHIVAAPSDFNIQYASINSGGIMKSTDGGLTWENKSAGISAAGRMEIAVANNDPNKVYVSAEGTQSGNDSDGDGVGSDLFVSVDGAENWALVLPTSAGTNPDFLGGQGFYDNTIAVHPYDDNIVYVGGVDVFKFTMDGSVSEGDLKVLGAEENGTDAFMTFVVFTESNFSNGSVAILTNEGTDISAEEFVSIEIRFGPGLSQKAHRFTVPDGATSGVDIANYSYADYVDVPFEVWDITNNKQLMVSFRDQQQDGVFNLNDGTETDRAISREYLFINAVDYDPNNPSDDIAQDGGRAFRQMYFFWPLLVEGETWDANNLPESQLVVNYGVGLEATRENVSIADAYGRHGGPNPFTQAADHSSVTGPHPDHHNLTIIKVDEVNETFKILNASDGGVYYTNTSATPGENNGDWTFAGNTMNTTQFYGIDKKKGSDEYLGGTQDNGTWKSESDIDADATTHYSRQLGGDGFEVVWNYNDTQKMLGTVYYNDISRSANGGQGWSNGASGITDNQAGTAPFITKLANVKFDPEVVYAVGASGVWKTTNFATSWTGIAIDDERWAFSGYGDVDISLANRNIVWAGSRMSSAGNLFVSQDGGETFEATNNYEIGLGVITGMATDPYDDQTFFAMFSYSGYPKILKTTDLGQTWTDISGFGDGSVSTNGFPDVAVYCMLVRPDQPDTYWVGTEIGLFESTDAGANWQLANNGLPAVSIWDMKVVDDQIVVGTHGRGIWTVTIPELVHNQNYVLSTTYVGQQTMEAVVDVRAAYDKLELYLDDELAGTFESVSAGEQTFTLTKSTEESSELYVKAYSGADAFASPSFATAVADFTPELNSAVSDNANEIMLEVDLQENYSKLEIYLDNELSSTVDNPALGANEFVIAVDESKIYSVKVVGYLNDIGYESQTLNVSVVSGLFSYFDSPEIEFYPNPASDKLTVELDGKKVNHVSVYSVNGKLMNDYSYSSNSSDELIFNVNRLSTGIYILNIQTDEKTFSSKFKIER